MTRNILCFWIVLLLFFGVGWVSKAQTVSVGNVQGCTGDTLVVPIMIQNVSMFSGINLNLSLPISGLTFIGINNIDPRLSSAQHSFDQVTGVWSFIWFNLYPITLNGNVCHIMLLSTAPLVDSIRWNLINSQLISQIFQPIPNISFVNGTIETNLTSVATTINATICSGQNYVVGNDTFFTTGQYVIRLDNYVGCDSVVELQLLVDSSIDTTNIGAFPYLHTNNFDSHTNGWNTSQRHYYNGSQTLGPFSNATVVFQQNNLPTHDSVDVAFDLYIHDSWDNNEPFQFSIDNQVVGTYYFGYWYASSYSGLTFVQQLGNRCWGSWQSNTKLYRVRFSRAHSSSQIDFRINVWDAQDPCDESWSIDNFQVSTTGQPILVCSGDTLFVGSHPVVASGTYSFLLSTAAGCDSLVRLYMRLKQRSDTTFLYKMLCLGEQVQFAGTTISRSGIYQSVFSNAVGCDSVVQYTIDTIPNQIMHNSSGNCSSDTFTAGAYIPDWLSIEWYRNQQLVKTKLRGINTTSSWSKTSSHPAGMFFDESSGALYVAETGNHRVVRWRPGFNTPEVVAGGNGQGSSPSQLNNPYDVFVTPNGDVFVSDFHNHRIQKWSPGASQGVTVAGGNGSSSGLHQLSGPYGLFVDSLNRIFIADHWNNRVVRWTIGIGSGIVYRFVSSPSDVFLDKHGSFYVSSFGDNQIFRWRSGQISPEIVAYVPNPHQITVDEAGVLYVAQYNSHKVSKHLANIADEFDLGLQMGCHPFGVAVSRSGSLYVSAHHCDHTVRRFDRSNESA
ncbi:MAG: hypothetical protein FJY17_07490, partial [Bacteroidetes bacterium]|nr:hypothetical protein [Bacteroidota bacterium]